MSNGSVDGALSAQLERIVQLNECITLHMARKDHRLPLAELKQEIIDVKELLGLCRECLEEHHQIAAKNYASCMRKLQLDTLFIAEALDKTDQFDNFKSPAPPKPLSSFSNKLNKTPRLLVSEYQNSPLSQRIKTTGIEFLDFHVTLTEGDFNRLSSYMRGRETLEELRSFLDTVIIKCLTEKYTLLCKKRSAVKSNDIPLWRVYNDQCSMFPDKKFFTQGDISRMLNKLIDKKMNNKLVMLRHLNIIQEIRKGPTVYYVWLPNVEN